LNKFEKEKKVIELHSKEGKTLKEIAPIVHMSFRDISKIYSKTFQKNEKNVKNAIIAANNHYAGFGPMTEKLFAEMMNLENKVKSFPIVDYKIPFKDFSELQVTKILKSINNYIPRQDKLTFLNFLNNFTKRI
jgi:hypothetical protein